MQRRRWKTNVIKFIDQDIMDDIEDSDEVKENNHYNCLLHIRSMSNIIHDSE